MRETTDVRVRKLAIIGAVREALQECGISHESCIIADDAATRAISDLFALEPAPKAGPQIMFVCDYCSEHNPEMCGYYDADQVRLSPNGQWLCETCYDNAVTKDGPGFAAAPTPPAVDAQDVGELVAAMDGLVKAVGNMRVPQTEEDAWFQIKVTLGPAFENARAALVAYKRSPTNGKS